MCCTIKSLGELEAVETLVCGLSGLFARFAGECEMAETPSGLPLAIIKQGFEIDLGFTPHSLINFVLN